MKLGETMKINHEETKKTKKNEDRRSGIEDRVIARMAIPGLRSSIIDHLRALRFFVVDFSQETL